MWVDISKNMRAIAVKQSSNELDYPPLIGAFCVKNMQVKKTFENVSVQSDITIKNDGFEVIIGLIPELNNFNIEPTTIRLTHEEAEQIMYTLMDLICK